jgi:predicted DNA-binding transcriptional regulator AlpA
MSQAKLLPADQVRARYGNISVMTLHRWMAGKPGFPQPVKIGARNFWRIEDLERFDSTLKTEKGRSPRATASDVSAPAAA